MAVSVTANLSLVSEANTTTGWSGNSGGQDTEVKIQGSGSYTWQASKSARTSCTFTPATNRDMSATDTHFYWWAKNDVAPFMETKTTGTTTASGYTIRFTDGGGDYKEFHIAGSDTWGGEWRCFVVDLANTSEIYAESGTMNWNDVDIITWYVDISNSGNIRIIDNQWNDVCRFGTGLTATGTAFDLTDIAADDEDSNNRYGVLENIDGVIFCQGKLTIGSGATTTTSDSDDEVLIFRDRIGSGNGIVSSTLYELVFAGSGCIADFKGLVLKGAGATDTTRPVIDASDTNADVTLDGCTIIHADTVEFAAGNDIQNSVFNDCFQITPSSATFQNNTISNYGGTTGALLLPTTTTNYSDNLFISAGTGHAFYITTAQSYTIADCTYSGYGSTGTTNAVAYNNSAGSVTLNINGGDSPTYRNGASASTTVNNAVIVRVTVKDAGTKALVDNARVFLETDPGEVEIFNEVTGVDGKVENTSYNYVSDTNVIGVVRQGTSTPYYKTGDISGTITSTGFDTTVLLIRDE